MFNQNDLNQISTRGIALPAIQKQVDHFIKGFPYICLVKPAIPGDGLLTFDDARKSYYIDFFEKKQADLKVVKFVPASGAASRMFKQLFEFRDKYPSIASVDEIRSLDPGAAPVLALMDNLGQIAFYDDLAGCMASAGMSLETLKAAREFATIIHYILNPAGLDYANLPKALLKFHRYADSARTAAEEHLVEAAEYTRDREGNARIHFTISPEHLEKFRSLFEAVKQKYELQLGVTFDISFSIQKPSTDTLAVDERNEPVRNQDGSLLFRPGGHGALLENLNEVDADLIFIKNIDNIVPDRFKPETYRHKKLLGGYLLSVREVITTFLSAIQNRPATREELSEMMLFSKKNLFIDFPVDLPSLPPLEQTEILFALLNKPIRVCGMVKNEGEPGGGPFWVKGDDHKLSLQIVEASQVDTADPRQKSILSAATHFNPVDLVCSTRDFESNTFDLKQFVDENTGFISLKSSGGRTLKAQELPGLWNGAMAKWITLFIEVPIITFNPVKTVNDLLRKEHIAI
ncbi:MAG: DUF4301 family protein [Bacteroidota bacterium]